jgi:hypothetical protein
MGAGWGYIAAIVAKGLKKAGGLYISDCKHVPHPYLCNILRILSFLEHKNKKSRLWKWLKLAEIKILVLNQKHCIKHLSATKYKNWQQQTLLIHSL